MKTIVFIGALKSGSSREAIGIAQDLGYFTVLITDNQKQIKQRVEYQDVHLMLFCDLSDINKLKTMIQELKLKAFEIKGIMSFVDSHVHTACLLGNIFKVNNFTTNGVYNIENKLLSRECLKNTDYVPQYKIISPSLEYSKAEVVSFLPAIIKSPCSTGSKDVYKVTNYQEFTDYLRQFQKKYPKQSVLLEKYLPGKQYLIEVFVIKGQVHIIAIVEQEIEYLSKHFIVTGYSILINPEASFYYKLTKTVKNIIYLHGLYHGNCHLEMRYFEDNFKLIEINPRISGGGMNQLIYAAFGINLVKEIIKLSLKQDVDLKPKYNKEAFIQYTTLKHEGILEKVTGKRRALRKNGVLKVYLKPRKGNLVYLPKSLGHRYAYVLATGKTQNEARMNAKQAIKELAFKIRKKK